MTREQAKHYMPFIQAWADGKHVQWSPDFTSEWQDVDWFNFPDFDKLTDGLDTQLTLMRIKPEPSYREWKPEEIPVGAVLYHKNDTTHRFSIIDVDHEGVTIHFRNCSGKFESCLVTFDLLRLYYNYTIDYGKTWRPCGVPIV